MRRSGRFLAAAMAVILLPSFSSLAGTFTTLTSVTGSADGAGDSAYGSAGLIDLDGTLYGTTFLGGATGHGTVFSINPQSGQKTVLYSFAGGNDGRNPIAALTAVGGTLYGTTYLGGAFNGGTVFMIDPAMGTEKLLYSLGANGDGAGPEGSLVAVDGKLYGTTDHGGYGFGTVFAVTLATGAEKLLYSFISGSDGHYPHAALFETGGELYGTTYGGGTSGNGTVFAVDPATGAEKVLHSFAGGSDGAIASAPLIEAGGTLYGTTQAGGTSGAGTVFSIAPRANGKKDTEKVVYSFPGGELGYAPQSALVKLGSSLFGTANGGASYQGLVFSLDPTRGSAKTVYSFSGLADGATPASSLTVAGSTLYGTTASGGTSGSGTIFSINPATGAEAVLSSFSGTGQIAANALLNINGTLFLTASTGGAASLGDVVKIVPSTGAATEIAAVTSMAGAASPQAPLIDVAGTLYGTSFLGGKYDMGTVFSLNPATGSQKLLYAFNVQNNGAYPMAALIKVGGKLYGTTAYGGDPDSDGGTLFSIKPSSGAEKLLHKFGGSGDGAQPFATLINVGGVLYGTTEYGGASNLGTVFSIDPESGVEKLLHSFSGFDDGAEPTAGLLALNGKLYGTTAGGGSNNAGTVFVLDPATGEEKLLYGFSGGADGGFPQSALINIGSTLYGNTAGGGETGNGTVFSINTATAAEKVLYSFSGTSDGGFPASALITIGNILYGTTDSGGATGRGTVFALKP
jgi:uncharacterized repeat protein (TIGR03803 family)